MTDTKKTMTTMTTATADLIDAMAWQAHSMAGALSDQLEDMFPDAGEPGLQVTGFLFRPSDDDDFEEGDDDYSDPRDTVYVFEAHFTAASHPHVGNISNKLKLHLTECESYTAASAKYVEMVQVNKARASANESEG